MSFTELKGIVSDFIAEAEEIFNQVDKDLVELESSPDDIQKINKIFRAVHTVKGSASFLGFADMIKAVHDIENVLNNVRQGDIEINQETLDDLLNYLDLAKDILEKIRKDQEPGAEGKKAAPGAAGGERKEDTGKTQPDSKAEDEKTVRVRVSKLNTLVNLVGELVLNRNQLVQQATSEERIREGDPTARRFSETAAKIGRITSELQQAVMNTRMQTINKVFGLFPRIVRDMANEQGKDVRLEISGENTEVDRSVIEAMQDSLIHFVRNAIDHGIETPEERISKSKPREGVIRISAFCEGSSVVVTVADDGRGVNMDAVLRSATDKGLVSFERASRLTSDEIVGFLFSPGFTTRAEADLTSGRGVGLDIVMNNIKKMNGSISVNSVADKGCEMRIKVPLTLAITQALIVGVGTEFFAVPSSATEETTRVTEEMISVINGRETMTLRGETMPLARLSQILAARSIPKRWMYAVIVRIAERRFALLVDNLRGQEDIVIKPVKDVMSIKGIAGATVLGDGKIVLVLDMGEIAESLTKGRAPGGEEGEAPGKGRRVLIADGSMSLRKIERKKFEEAGYQVTEAANGEEALDALLGGGEAFDLIICDSALPEIDGIRLTEKIKAEPKLKPVPVVLLTSIYDQVDSDYGYQIGVEDFLVRQEVDSLPAAVARYIIR